MQENIQNENQGPFSGPVGSDGAPGPFSGEIAELTRRRKQEKKNWKILFWVSLAVFLIGLAGTIYLNPKLKDQSVEGIRQVKVTITDVDTTTVKSGTSRTSFYKVTVQYEGKNYKLKGAASGNYREGSTITAYLYEGKIYVDENAVKSGTMIGILYYCFLIPTFVLLFTVPVIGTKAFSDK